MKKNVGILDKAIRIIAAILIIALYFTNINSGFWAMVLLAIAGIFIATSFMSFCPLYYLIGLSSNKKVKQN